MKQNFWSLEKVSVKRKHELKNYNPDNHEFFALTGEAEGLFEVYNWCLVEFATDLPLEDEKEI